MTDYLVYRAGGELELQLYSQYAEDDLLLKHFEPGKSLVLIPNVVGANEAEARQQAAMYFHGDHPDTRDIDRWVEKALQRQAHLLSP